MELKILQILKSYEENACNVDYSFIKYVSTLLRDKYQVHEYLKKILVYRNDNTRFGGSYYPKNKALYINLLSANHVCYICDYKLQNIFILITMFHELEHIIHEKILDNYDSLDSDNNYIYDLLSLGKKGYSINTNIYHLIPNERLANIKAYSKVIKILSLDYSRYYLEIHILKMLLHDIIIYGYDNNKCPLMKYIEILNSDGKYAYTYSLIVEEAKKDSISCRVLYGLPITRGEYNLITASRYKNLKLVSERYRKLEKVLKKDLDFDNI